MRSTRILDWGREASLSSRFVVLDVTGERERRFSESVGGVTGRDRDREVVCRDTGVGAAGRDLRDLGVGARQAADRTASSRRRLR